MAEFLPRVKAKTHSLFSEGTEPSSALDVYLPVDVGVQNPSTLSWQALQNWSPDSGASLCTTQTNYDTPGNTTERFLEGTRPAHFIQARKPPCPARYPTL